MTRPLTYAAGLELLLPGDLSLLYDLQYPSDALCRCILVMLAVAARSKSTMSATSSTRSSTGHRNSRIDREQLDDNIVSPRQRSKAVGEGTAAVDADACALSRGHDEACGNKGSKDHRSRLGPAFSALGVLWPMTAARAGFGSICPRAHTSSDPPTHSQAASHIKATGRFYKSSASIHAPYLITRPSQWHPTTPPVQTHAQTTRRRSPRWTSSPSRASTSSSQAVHAVLAQLALSLLPKQVQMSASPLGLPQAQTAKPLQLVMTTRPSRLSRPTLPPANNIAQSLATCPT